MRIDKFLVSQNICTRKEAQKLVRKGLVKIDSEIVKKPETKLDPNINKVTIDDIDNVKKLICNPAAYSGVAVTNKRVDWKKIWKWQ